MVSFKVTASVSDMIESWDHWIMDHRIVTPPVELKTIIELHVSAQRRTT